METQTWRQTQTETWRHRHGDRHRLRHGDTDMETDTDRLLLVN